MATELSIPIFMINRVVRQNIPGFFESRGLTITNRRVTNFHLRIVMEETLTVPEQNALITAIQDRIATITARTV